jgi:hypothetical protein
VTGNDFDKEKDLNNEDLETYNDDEKCSVREERYEEVLKGDKPKTFAISILAAVLGFLSVVGCFGGFPGVILGTLAVCASLISRKRLGFFDPMCLAGLVLGIFGAVFGVTVLLAMYGPLKGVMDAVKERLG